MKAVLLLPLSLFFSLYAAPEPLSLNPWRWMPDWFPPQFEGVTYLNQQAFIFGTRGKILRDPGGETTRPITEDTVYGIAFGNSEYLAVGDHGLIWTSKSGETWEAVPRPTINRLRAVVHARGKWIVAGDRGTILWSTNKYEWNTSVVPPNSGSFIARQAVILLEHVLLVGSVPGAQGEPKGAVLRSTDGTRWELATIPDVPTLLDAAVGTNGVVAVGQGGGILSSADGVTWLNRSAPSGLDWIAVASGAGYFVTISPEGYGLTSTNGVNWDPLENDFYHLYRDFPGYRDLVSLQEEGKGAFAAFLIEGNSRRFDFDVPLKLRGAYPGFIRNYFALVEGPNGWTYRAEKGVGISGGVSIGEEFSLNRLKDDVVIHRPGGFYFWSRQWSLEPGPDFTSVKIIEANDRFVAITPNGEIYSSRNITDWERVLAVPDGAFTGLTFENGMFVATGRESSETGTGLKGFIYSSPDGRTWTKSFSSEVMAIHDVANGGGFFVAVGHEESAAMSLVSSNGLNWRASAAIPDLRLDNVAYGNGLWVASGFDIRPQVFASIDGLNWIKLHCPVDNPINEVAFANSRFYLLGLGEFVESSGPGDLFEITKSTDPSRPENEVRITVRLFGSPVELQSSADLRTWTTETVTTNSTGAINLYDAATNQARFYRLSPF